MAAIRTTATFLCKEMMIIRPSTSLTSTTSRHALRMAATPFCFISLSISYTPLRCVASARMSQVHQLLHDAIQRSSVNNRHEQPIPKITLDHVNVSFARSGGPGGQNVNKVNTKVHMRFNIKEAYWLSERVKEKILQMEKKRINKDGELVISSTKTRTQRGNIQDALQKVQEIIDTACYVPPPPSEEQLKKIAKLVAISESRRLQGKKVLSQKKAFRRRSRGR